MRPVIGYLKKYVYLCAYDFWRNMLVVDTGKWGYLGNNIENREHPTYFF
jgi:hypothetical protein